MMQKICNLDEFPASGCVEFTLHGEGRDFPCFLVRHEGGLSAYRNCCPHTGAPLNWNPNVFLNVEGTLIQCAIHGAQFRINDGHCLYGPCAGQSLDPVSVVMNEGEVWALQEDVPKVP